MNHFALAVDKKANSLRMVDFSSKEYKPAKVTSTSVKSIRRN